jgi:hypothetical protein
MIVDVIMSQFGKWLFMLDLQALQMRYTVDQLCTIPFLLIFCRHNAQSSNMAT